MIIYTIGLLVVAGLLVWHMLGDPHQEHEVYMAMKAQERLRNERRAELKEAYNLAKEELGQEPTIEQIFLTRDQLRMQKGLK